MARTRNNKDQQAAPARWESLIVRPLQALTDGILAGCGRRHVAPAQKSIYLGRSPQLYHSRQFDEMSLELELLCRHLWIVGQSGAGKTSLIILMLMALAFMKLGFAVIDVHGDLSRAILNFIASTLRTEKDIALALERLVYIEPFDPIYAPGFNLLQSPNARRSYAEALDLLGIFKRIWKDVAWGARMEELLRNLLLTLSFTSRTLAEAPRFLVNAEFRNFVLRGLSEPDLQFYWNDRFGILSDRMRPMYVEPVLNKLTVFTSDPYIRHIIAQPGSALDFRRIMDDGKWLILNLAKGALSQNTMLLGSIFTAKIKSAAMSRSDIPESQRVPFPFFVDEFQNFMGQEFHEFLSESRKYKVGLILSHQNLAQIEPAMREAIFGNVGTMILFKLGHNDIREVAAEFDTASQPMLRRALSTLGVGEAIRRENDGTFRKIAIQRLPDIHANDAVVAKLRQTSYDKYYRLRSVIDAESATARQNTSQGNIVIHDTDKSRGRHRSRPDGGEVIL